MGGGARARFPGRRCQPCCDRGGLAGCGRSRRHHVLGGTCCGAGGLCESPLIPPCTRPTQAIDAPPSPLPPSPFPSPPMRAGIGCWVLDPTFSAAFCLLLTTNLSSIGKQQRALSGSGGTSTRSSLRGRNPPAPRGPRSSRSSTPGSRPGAPSPGSPSPSRPRSRSPPRPPRPPRPRTRPCAYAWHVEDAVPPPFWGDFWVVLLGCTRHSDGTEVVVDSALGMSKARLRFQPRCTGDGGMLPC